MMWWVLFGACGLWCWKASQVDLMIWSPPSWAGQAVVAVGQGLAPKSSAWLRAPGAAWRVGQAQAPPNCVFWPGGGP